MFPLTEVTIIPTYDTDVLGYWVAENEELLTELKIDLAPSASRCTINLQVLTVRRANHVEPTPGVNKKARVLRKCKKCSSTTSAIIQ